MTSRLLGAVLRRWAGDLSRADEPVLGTILRRGAHRDRIRAARLLRYTSLLPWLADPVPGVRRAAAWSIGRAGTEEARSVLLGRLTEEAAEVVRFELAVAAVRCGADRVSTYDRLDTRRELLTTTGLRAAPDALGPEATSTEWRYRQALEADADEIRRSLVRGFDEPLHLVTLALRQDPSDFALLFDAAERAGRRARHVALEALGLHGDPRAVPLLERALEDVSADPGFGFRSRRTAALALARIGDPDVLSSLVKALEVEALDYEGRPGSGLGIQAPVRAALLHAIGEIGNPAGRRVVAGYIGHTHGAAGGLHIAAMSALIKLGGFEEATALLDADETTAVHALAILAALGRDDLVAGRAADPRPAVSAAAHALAQ